jgi:hypothetical protein
MLLYAPRFHGKLKKNILGDDSAVKSTIPAAVTPFFTITFLLAVS